MMLSATEKQKIEDNKPKYEIGKIVKFGEFPTTANGKKEPVEWIILDVAEDRMLVITRFGITRKAWNDTIPLVKNILWKDSTIRKWLNTDFVEKTFSEEERKRILVTPHEEDYREVFFDSTPAVVSDEVFLLNVPEAEKYFRSSAARAGEETAFAHAERGSAGYRAWWLRTSIRESLLYAGTAAIVLQDGGISVKGINCNEKLLIRPAMWLSTENCDLHSYDIKDLKPTSRETVLMFNGDIDDDGHEVKLPVSLFFYQGCER